MKIASPQPLSAMAKIRREPFTCACMSNRQSRQGFTLIELVVSLLLAGICTLLTTRLFVEAYKLYYSYRDKDSGFFSEYRDELHFRKLLREQPWVCREDGSFAFTTEGQDSLLDKRTDSSLRCEQAPGTGRILVCIEHHICVPGK